ncbi:MAG: hypothetical protein ABJB66_19405 [Gemmatimonadaceae bacterium]
MTMSLRRTFFRNAVVVCSLSFGAATSAFAQTNYRLATVNDGPSHALTLNPFFLLAGWVSAEYEQRINPSVTLGGAFNHQSFDDDRYSDFDFKARLYATEHAMRGFSIVMSAGVSSIRISNNDYFCDFLNSSNCSPTKKTVTSPSLGVELNYQWLLGTARHTAVAIGFGGKRYLASEETLNGSNKVIPTFRLGIGYAF